MVFLADIQERHELCLNLLQFLGILLVGIFQVLEGAARVDVVAGIDAYLLAVLGGHVSGMCREMDVGHEGCCVAVGLQLCRDILHVFGFTCALRSETHQFAASIDDALGLGNTAFGVVGVGRRH